MECERDARRLVRAKVSLIDRKKDMVDQLGNALTKAGIKAGSGPEVLMVYDQKTAGEPITNPHVRLPPLKAERLKKAVVLGQPRKMNLAKAPSILTRASIGSVDMAAKHLGVLTAKRPGAWKVLEASVTLPHSHNPPHFSVEARVLPSLWETMRVWGLRKFLAHLRLALFP